MFPYRSTCCLFSLYHIIYQNGYVRQLRPGRVCRCDSNCRYGVCWDQPGDNVCVRPTPPPPPPPKRSVTANTNTRVHRLIMVYLYDKTYLDQKLYKIYQNRPWRLTTLALSPTGPRSMGAVASGVANRSLGEARTIFPQLTSTPPWITLSHAKLGGGTLR